MREIIKIDTIQIVESESFVHDSSKRPIGMKLIIKNKFTFNPIEMHEIITENGENYFNLFNPDLFNLDYKEYDLELGKFYIVTTSLNSIRFITDFFLCPLLPFLV